MGRFNRDVFFVRGFYISLLLFAFVLSFAPHWSSKALAITGLIGLLRFSFTQLRKSLFFLLVICFAIFYSLVNMFTVGVFDYEWISLFLVLALCHQIFNWNEISHKEFQRILFFFCLGVYVVGGLNFGNLFISDVSSIINLKFFDKWDSHSLIDIHKLYFGLYLNFALLIVLNFYTENKIRTLQFFLHLIYITTLLFFCGSRGAITIALLLIILWASFKFIGEKIVWFVLIPVLFLIIMFVTDLTVLMEWIDGDLSRLRNFIYNKQAFLDSPWFGHGIGNEFNTIQSYRSPRGWEYLQKYNAHNQYMEFLVGGGVFWMAIFLLFIVYFLIRVRIDGLSVGFVLIILTTFLFESILNRHHGVFFFAFFYTLFIVYYKNMEDKNKNPAEILKSNLASSMQYEEHHICLNTFLNAYSYLLFRKELNLFNHFSIRIDGIAMIYVLRLFGIKMKRSSFDMTSMAPKVFNYCIEKEKEVFFIGSSEENIVGFVGMLRRNFPFLKIKGFRNGFFTDEEEKNLVIHEITKKNPDIIVVGTGTPLQEQLLLKLKMAGWQGVGFTCGGFIHQTSKRLDYYPKFFDKYNLRWLYRIYDEPKLIKRYLFKYPKSICLLIFDLTKLSLQKNA